MSAHSRKTETDRTVNGIVDVVRRFQPVLEQAKALGIFTGERELLECPECRLVEDVDCDGRLMTYRDGEEAEDSGLRFEEIAEGRYRCPACGAKAQEEVSE